ncbi:MAG: phosphodiesterase [Kofleriaceae bacterium]|jgi:Icc protein|nr:phosphodiesterase [Kofleriaceae bacterium]MBP6840135.1 phosphodiesterase [Kofleriaceae bacterium]MBP9207643.1 phosphodiesterase [Kofleriaceae bacterium]
MRIAQLTDLHISDPTSVNETQLRTGPHLARAVAHLCGPALRPDCVLLTGDLVEHGRADEYARLRELLAPLPMPVFVVPGNHDDRAAMAAAFADHAYLPQDGGFLHYAVDDAGPVRLVGLDTVVPGKPSGELCAERLAWLDARLAEQPTRPTLVFMHHPPFSTGIAAMDAMGLAGADALAAVLRRHPQVERVACGHQHRPITRRFAGTVAMVAPATAHQLALTLPPGRELALVMEPPACALHLWLGEADGLVSHLSVIGSERPPYPLYDGERWIAGGPLPPGFHPPE